MRPTSIPELCQAVRSAGCVLPRGGGTKPSLSNWCADAEPLEMSGMSGITEYEHTEFTFTALAGTPLAEVQATLAGHGQYLPFDPPLAQAGATLGGTVAAAMNGAGRLRYGGVRDFVVGIAWVDGDGILRRGGGKVVKNAAGFDFPKFFCGSLGCLGVIAELSFKVFPQAQARATLAFPCGSLTEALECIARLGSQPWEMEAVECVPGSEPVVMARFMGSPAPLQERVSQIRRAMPQPSRVLSDAEAAAFWHPLSTLEADHSGLLARVVLTPAALPALDAALPSEAWRHYSMAGHTAWVGGVAHDTLDKILTKSGLSGLALRGLCQHPRLGVITAPALERSLKHALDPHSRFPALLPER